MKTVFPKAGLAGELGRAYTWSMPKRSRKPSGRDPVKLARSIVDQATGVEPPPALAPAKRKRPAKKAEDKRDPAAVALGRRGGLKGGVARAKKLSAEERAESAKKAAQARWSK